MDLHWTVPKHFYVNHKLCGFMASYRKYRSRASSKELLGVVDMRNETVLLPSSVYSNFLENVPYQSLGFPDSVFSLQT